jgi:hypothetical protein
MILRRDFIALLGGAAAGSRLPLRSRAACRAKQCVKTVATVITGRRTPAASR